jgi:beta-lactamase regulating signal transducer with metallopeptidase domain
VNIWRMWLVGQIDATIVAVLLLAAVQLLRHRIPPAMRSWILLIALVRLALPPFVQSPWSEAAVDVPPVDEARGFIATLLQDDRFQYLFMFTVLVSLALLARLAWQVSSSGRRLRATTRLAPEWLQMRARNLATTGSAEVRISESGDGPFAAGIRQRLIVLPAALVDGLDTGALDAALAHEIAHHERRDLLWIAAAKALQALAWCNPLAHVIARAIGAAREDGSDDWAVGHTSKDAFTYAHALLKSARMVARSDGGLLVAGAHPMGSRFRRLLDAGAARDRRIGVIGVVVILTVMAAALPGAHMPQLSSSDDDRRVVIVIRN